MVKVRIENNGKVTENEGDLTVGVTAKFQEDRTEAAIFLTGMTNKGKLVKLLLNVIPSILKSTSKDDVDYIDSMMDFGAGLEKKIMSELKENADAVAEMIRKL